MTLRQRPDRTEVHRALRAVRAWLDPHRQRAVSLLVTRLAAPPGAGSFVAVADLSALRPSGERGTLTGHGGAGYLLGFRGGSPVPVNLAAEVDLDLGRVSLRWTAQELPAQLAAFALGPPTVQPPPHGPAYVFDTESPSDQAVYSCLLALLG